MWRVGVGYLSPISICHCRWMPQGECMWQRKGCAHRFLQRCFWKDRVSGVAGLEARMLQRKKWRWCVWTILPESLILKRRRERNHCSNPTAPKAAGLERWFSNLDLWKYSLSIRPENLNTHTHAVHTVSPGCPLITENYLGISVPLVIFVFTIKVQPGGNPLKTTFQQKLFLLYEKRDGLHGSDVRFCVDKENPDPVLRATCSSFVDVWIRMNIPNGECLCPGKDTETQGEQRETEGTKYWGWEICHIKTGTQAESLITCIYQITLATGHLSRKQLWKLPTLKDSRTWFSERNYFSGYIS